MVARMPWLGAALLLAGCAVPEARLRSGLVRAGLEPDLAHCMAERMVDRLSLGQLMRIGDLPAAGRPYPIDEFVHRLRALGDPEIVSVAASSAFLCRTGLANESR